MARKYYKDEEAHGLMQMARGLALTAMPWTADILYKLTFVEDVSGKVKTMAVNTKGHLFYRPSFAKWPDPDPATDPGGETEEGRDKRRLLALAADLLHEHGHIKYNHAARQEANGYDQVLWNRAGDREINDDLTRLYALLDGVWEEFKIQRWALQPGQIGAPEGYSADLYYAVEKKKGKKPPPPKKVWAVGDRAKPKRGKYKGREVVVISATPPDANGKQNVEYAPVDPAHRSTP